VAKWVRLSSGNSLPCFSEITHGTYKATTETRFLSETPSDLFPQVVTDDGERHAATALQVNWDDSRDATTGERSSIDVDQVHALHIFCDILDPTSAAHGPVKGNQCALDSTAPDEDISETTVFQSADIGGEILDRNGNLRFYITGEFIDQSKGLILKHLY